MLLQKAVPLRAARSAAHHSHSATTRAKTAALGRQHPLLHGAQLPGASYSVMRDAVHGMRPPDAALAAHVEALLRDGYTRRALVAAVTSLPLHASYPTATLVSLLDAYARRPADPPARHPIRQILDCVLASSSASGLTEAQLDTVLAVAAKYKYGDFVLRVAEHACAQGAVLSKAAACAIIDALGQRSGGKSDAQVAAWYAAVLALLKAARIPVDGDIAVSLVRLLCGGRAAAFRDAKRPSASLGSSSSSGTSTPPPVAHSDRSRGAAAGADTAPRLQPRLDAAFALVRGLPPDTLHLGRALTALLQACLRSGQRERASEVLGDMSSRRVPPPASVFNALITTSAPLGGGGGGGGAGRAGADSAAVYLGLMREHGVAPTPATLLALTKAYLYASTNGAGAAGALQGLSDALQVPVTQQALGAAAFYAAKCGNFEEVEELIRMLRRHPPRPPRAGREGSGNLDGVEAGGTGRDAASPSGPSAPRWLVKMSTLVAHVAADPTDAPRRGRGRSAVHASSSSRRSYRRLQERSFSIAEAAAAAEALREEH